MLLTINKISKSYGINQVLNQVSFLVSPGQKVGLVGANGVGKSTLLKIIVGEVEADGGSLSIAPHRSIGYLPQVLASGAEQTVAEMIDTTLSHITTLERRMRAIESAMQQPQDNLTQLLAEYSEISEEFERRGGYDLAYRVDTVCAGLGVDQIERTRRMATLSGGEKTRIGLALMLLRNDDLLLLDEPTNHLDFAAMEWLEGYLHSFDGGVLVVSHDRQFLNQTVDTIVEIDEYNREAKIYSGDYDFYAAAKALEREKWLIEYEAQQEEIRALRHAIKVQARQVAHNRPPSDGDKLAYNAKGSNVQAQISHNVRSAEEKLRRIETDPIPKPPKPLAINPEFNPQQLVNRTPIVLSQIHKAYGEQTVLDGIDCAVYANSRIVIIGPNGAGKSTLLKIMAGVEQADSGDRFVAATVVIGHLDQEQETLTRSGTLFDAYREGRVGEWEELKTELLSYGLFTWPDLLKPVAALSVGQKRKLQIAQLMARKANLLLLDEPTNHISLDVLEEFEAALLNFPGPVVAVSHDRRFIQRFAKEVWEVQDGKLSTPP
ncbi:MAG: ABC-F family ATP-binding cassette domain-containing protein [Caldilineaceae bacterium]